MGRVVRKDELLPARADVGLGAIESTVLLRAGPPTVSGVMALISTLIAVAYVAGFDATTPRRVGQHAKGTSLPYEISESQSGRREQIIGAQSSASKELLGEVAEECFEDSRLTGDAVWQWIRLCHGRTY